MDGIVQETIPDRSALRPHLRTSQDPGDPDTLWIGHIDDPLFTAGGKMPAGGAGPYHVGRGPNRPIRGGAPTTIAGDGMWSFDRFQPGETDSLFGWWPIVRPFQSLGGSNNPDYQRPFFGLDYGNQVNYVINQGAPKRTFGVVGLWHRDAGSLVVYGVNDTLASYFSSGRTANTDPAPSGNVREPPDAQHPAGPLVAHRVRWSELDGLGVDGHALER